MSHHRLFYDYKNSGRMNPSAKPFFAAVHNTVHDSMNYAVVEQEQGETSWVGMVGVSGTHQAQEVNPTEDSNDNESMLQEYQHLLWFVYIDKERKSC